MKAQVLFELNIPRNAEPRPELKADGGVELLWTLPNGSYCRLLFEDARPVEIMWAKLVGLQAAQRQAKETNGDAS